MIEDASDGATIVRLVGVYDADGTLRGEVTYWVGKRLGRVHCALCDITHGSVRERSDWKACRAGLPVAFDTFHRNDQPDPLRAHPSPLVAAETTAGFLLLLGPDELDACAADPNRLVDAVTEAVNRLGLSWT